MIALIIDTSTERGCVAIAKKDKIIYQKELPKGFHNSKALLPEVQRAFTYSEVAPKQLHYVIVGVGPGSYTGIRVGVMTAKAMAYALKIPLVGISSLEGFVPDRDCRYAAVIDAKIGGVYIQMGERENGVIKDLSQPRVYSLNEAVDLLADREVLVTPNGDLIQGKFAALKPKAHWEWLEVNPSPMQLAMAGAKKFEKGEVSHNGDLEILYLRKTQAELEKGL